MRADIDGGRKAYAAAQSPGIPCYCISTSSGRGSNAGRLGEGARPGRERAGQSITRANRAYTNKTLVLDKTLGLDHAA